jgi:hypothetical protein
MLCSSSIHGSAEEMVGDIGVDWTEVFCSCVVPIIEQRSDVAETEA